MIRCVSTHIIGPMSLTPLCVLCLSVSSSVSVCLTLSLCVWGFGPLCECLCVLSECGFVGLSESVSGWVSVSFFISDSGSVSVGLSECEWVGVCVIECLWRSFCHSLECVCLSVRYVSEVCLWECLSESVWVRVCECLFICFSESDVGVGVWLCGCVSVCLPLCIPVCVSIWVCVCVCMRDFAPVGLTLYCVSGLRPSL